MKKKLMADLAIPIRNKRRNLQVEIDVKLFDALEEEVKRNDHFKRDIIEWGIRLYILRSNPAVAAELKILSED